jgi:predicted DNA-binding transcriptional regulator AlpA
MQRHLTIHRATAGAYSRPSIAGGQVVKHAENSSDDFLLTRQQVEEDFGFPTKRYLEIVANRMDGPPQIRIGRTVRYRRSDVRAWLDAHRTPPIPDSSKSQKVVQTHDGGQHAQSNR